MKLYNTNLARIRTRRFELVVSGVCMIPVTSNHKPQALPGSVDFFRYTSQLATPPTTSCAPSSSTSAIVGPSDGAFIGLS